MLEQVVCESNGILEGELKEVEFGSGKILLSKHNGVISAVSAKCTHYGAPLITGAYKNGKVRCPWHGACFNTTTGDIEDFPGLDNLHKYEVSIKDGKVIVSGDEKTLKDFRCTKAFNGDCKEKEIYLIVGGGGAAIICAETLRKEGFIGQIILATAENHLPYDRPKLSKALNTEPSKLYLRSNEFFKERKIEILFNKKAVQVDSDKNVVHFEDGTRQTYTKLFTATGGSPRPLTIPGCDLKNILYLRTPEDANFIDTVSPDKDLVVIGTGFISMELAAYFAKKCKSVTVIGSGRSRYPFERLLGERIGKMYYEQHISKGIKFYLDQPIKEIKGNDGTVTHVVLKNDETIKADVIIAGIGVSPSTGYFKNTNVQLDKAGHVIVDKFLQASDNIFCGGDIVLFPYRYDNDRLVNIGHWQLASYHGKCAALNMLGKKIPCSTVPFFWSGQFGKSLRYAGHCEKFDEIIYDGNVEEMTFAAYYYSVGKLAAVACMNMGAKASEVAFWIEDGTTPTPEELKKQINAK